MSAGMKRRAVKCWSRDGGGDVMEMETEAGVILLGSLFEEKREPCDQATRPGRPWASV